MEDISVMAKPIFKNIELEWNSLKKVLSCQVCNKPPGNSLVSHYVNEHPNSEVLISRLAPEAAEKLRSQEGINECKIVQQPGSACYEYQQFCYFCNVNKSLNKYFWINHMIRHTGYYRYKCNHCSRLYATRPQKIKCWKLNDFTIVAQPQFQKRVIKAYICDLCNYVRFFKKEIEMHLRNEHEDDSKKFKEFPFLQFPARQSKCKSKYVYLKDFIVQAESEYETDTDSECETDLESEFESDWESDWESNGELVELKDEDVEEEIDEDVEEDIDEDDGENEGEEIEDEIEDEVEEEESSSSDDGEEEESDTEDGEDDDYDGK